MSNIINSNNHQKREHDSIIGISKTKDKNTIEEKNVLEFQKERREDETGQKFHQRILHGNFCFAIPALPQETQKTENRDELIPRKFVLASHAAASPPERPFGIKPNNYHIQETPDNQTENEEDNCED
jgi:hypothetical protein